MTSTINTVFTKEQEELLDYIADYTGNAFSEYFDSLDEEDQEGEHKLLEELSDLGIENQEQFEERYVGHWDGWHSERDFTRDYMVDCCDYINSDHPLFDFIDWQAYWDCNLRHDFTTLQDVFFFYNR